MKVLVLTVRLPWNILKDQSKRRVFLKDRLIIIGAGGHGKVCADIALKINKWNNIYFLDNNLEIEKCLDLPVIGPIADALKYKEGADYFVAIGNNKIRERIQLNLEENDCTIATLIHPYAIINSHVQIKKGSVIMAGVVINSNTCIDRGSIINTNSTIEHDNQIGKFVHISPGVNIGGTVEIGDRTWIGIGSSVINDLKINSDITFGARSLVLENIKTKGTYYGSPLKRR